MVRRAGLEEEQSNSQAAAVKTTNLAQWLLMNLPMSRYMYSVCNCCQWYTYNSDQIDSWSRRG